MFRFSLPKLMIVLAVFAPSCLSAEEPTTTVSVDDLGKRVVVLGRLGSPLGKGNVLTIKGHWMYPEEDDKGGLRFVVTAVDGVRVAKPVEFFRATVRGMDKNGNEIRPIEGDRWKMRGFETGEFSDISAELEEEQGLPLIGRPIWKGTFTARLVGVVSSIDAR